jgi:lysophospholipase L1-like esterase
MGDANADWLAYGLEEAYSEKPEIAVARKHRTDSGLIRYDPRRDTEWPLVAREILAADKPKFIVMMIGNNDRQSIREKPPAVVRPTAPKPNTPQVAQQPTSRVQQPPVPGVPSQTDAEQQPTQPGEPVRAASYGPWEFHTEKWEVAYIKRIDATISALKSAGVPVIWVGLPSQRDTKLSADSAYLNELYRSRAERAGITYVDVWDGFVDEDGRFSPQGADYEGQIRRLRSGDGIYFTQFGARKLAHYVDKEIQRYLANRPVPVALPIPTEAEKRAAKPGAPTQQVAPSQRPSVGPVVPLTVNHVQSEELLGGGSTVIRIPAGDATASRVLNKGEPMQVPRGRADDFSWPRSGVEIDQSALETTAPSPPPATSVPTTSGTGTPAARQQPERNAGERKPVQRPARNSTSEGPLPFFQQIFPGLFRF